MTAYNAPFFFFTMLQRMRTSSSREIAKRLLISEASVLAISAVLAFTKMAEGSAEK